MRSHPSSSTLLGALRRRTRLSADVAVQVPLRVNVRRAHRAAASQLRGGQRSCWRVRDHGVVPRALLLQRCVQLSFAKTFFYSVVRHGVARQLAILSNVRVLRRCWHAEEPRVRVTALAHRELDGARSRQHHQLVRRVAGLLGLLVVRPAHALRAHRNGLRQPQDERGRHGATSAPRRTRAGLSSCKRLADRCRSGEGSC
jgi:hypothetical protein